jgi:hypothetical protein
MRRMLGTMAYILAFAILLLSGSVPAAAQGSGSSTETVTAQVSLTLPNAQPLTGTIVNQRVLGSPVQSRWAFTGMLAGQPVRVAGTATERWMGDGQIVIDVTAITEYRIGAQQPTYNADGSIAIPALLRQSVVVVGQGNGIVVVAGFPLAISGRLSPPGSGNLNYTLTNAGQGPAQVVRLPNTSAAAPHAWRVPQIDLRLGAALLLLGFAAAWAAWRPSVALEGR